MRHRNGLTTLTALLIMSAALLTAGISLHASLRQTLSVVSHPAYTERAETLAQSCYFEAWNQLATNRAYAGDQLMLDTGTCRITVTNDEKTYIIQVQAETLPASAHYEFALEDQDGVLTPIKLTHIH